MDSLINAAARALAQGDPLGALKRVALREDAPALALRGIAMAQLGDFDRAKALLKSAARAFSPREAVARARCIVAQAEIALVSRDLTWPVKALHAARKTLQVRGDVLNAAHARNLEARRLLLVGRLDEAERELAGVDASALPPATLAAHELVVAGIAIRRLQTRNAREALAHAKGAALEARIPGLMAEVENAASVMDAPAARLIANGEQRLLLLDEVEALFSSGALVIDACRTVVRESGAIVPLGTRPVLFALARTLAEAWPGDASRETLVRRAFRGKEADESHRARLRVEMGRLRAELSELTEISATRDGFVLEPRDAKEVTLLVPPAEEPHPEVLALLADGESWSSSALAIALGTSARTVQRALEELSGRGKVQSYGRGRALRWVTPSVPGFPTSLLLPGPLPGD